MICTLKVLLKGSILSYWVSVILHYQKWPCEDVPGFRDKQVSFFMHCKELSLRILRLMGLSLGLDADVFVSAHKQIGST